MGDIIIFGFAIVLGTTLSFFDTAIILMTHFDNKFPDLLVHNEICLIWITKFQAAVIRLINKQVQGKLGKLKITKIKGSKKREVTYT